MLWLRRSVPVFACAAVGVDLANNKHKTTPISQTKTEPIVKKNSINNKNKRISPQSQSVPSWSKVVTEVQSTQHSHTWVIKGFSQCKCKYLETTFKPVSSIENHVCPTFRVRLIPLDHSSKNVWLQVSSDDRRAKYWAKLSLYNANNEQIATKVLKDSNNGTSHKESVLREALVSHCGQEDELRVELDLFVTFDTKLNEENKVKPKQDNQQSKVRPHYRSTMVILSQSDGRSHPQIALVDSGAVHNMIKPSAAHHWKWNKTKMTRVAGLGGGSIGVDGEVLLDVRIGDIVTKKQRFLVSHIKTRWDVILGTEFHDALGSIAFHKHHMEVNGQRVKYDGDNSDSFDKMDKRKSIDEDNDKTDNDDGKIDNDSIKNSDEKTENDNSKTTGEDKKLESCDKKSELCDKI